jgi:hypothetical protein
VWACTNQLLSATTILKYNSIIVSVTCYREYVTMNDTHTYIHKPSRYFQYSYSHFIHSAVCLDVHSLFQRELYTTWKLKRTMLLLQQKPLHITEQVHFRRNCREIPVEQVARVSHVTVGSYRSVPYSWWGVGRKNKKLHKVMFEKLSTAQLDIFGSHSFHTM